MKLHESGLGNSVAKSLAPTLSWLVVGRRRISLARKLIAYANFLMGKGSGTGWDIDSEITAAVKAIFRTKPVIFDVGGNVGQWSQRILQHVTPEHIYIFEPQPACQQRIEALNLPGVTLVRTGVGEQAGTAKLFTASETDLTASLHERNDSFFEDWTYAPTEIEIVALDDFIAERQIPFIDFMKMDIEGHELFALRGLRKSIDAGVVGAMSFEFSSGNLNSHTCFRDIWKVLSPNYNIYRVTPARKLIHIAGYYEDLEYFRGASNHVAVLKAHPHAPANHRFTAAAEY
jgi:FkbM family methyltransferase